MSTMFYVVTVLAVLVGCFQLIGATSVVGWPPIERPNTYHRNDQVVVDKRLYFPTSGKIKGFRFYTGEIGSAQIQIWRPQRGDNGEPTCTMQLIRFSRLYINENKDVGKVMYLSLSSPIDVQCGDLLGLEITSDILVSPITYTMEDGPQYHCVKANWKGMLPGSTYQLTDQFDSKPSRKYSLMAVYDEANPLTIGWVPIKRPYVDTSTARTYVDKRMKFETDGEVVAWQFHAKAAGVVFFQVWRPTSYGPCSFRLIGQTRYESKEGQLGIKHVLLKGDERIKVKADDVIGWRNPGKGVISGWWTYGDQQQCFLKQKFTPVGQVYHLRDTITYKPNRKYSLRAIVQSCSARRG